MLNYMKSENYRIARKKGMYAIGAVCLLLLLFAGAVLSYFGRTDAAFPYDRADFFYVSILGMSPVILAVAFLFNLLLNSKENQRILKQTVSFGISRTTVYWSKFFVTLAYFAVFCVICLGVAVGLAHLLFPADEQATAQFLPALLNISPLVCGAFALAHALNSLRVKEAIVAILLVVVFFASRSLFYFLKKLGALFEVLYEYSPGPLFDENITAYMDYNVHMDPKCWITGLLITVFSLALGHVLIQRKVID